MRFVGRLLTAIFTLGLLSITASMAQVNEPDADQALAPTEEWVRMTPEEYIYRWRTTAVEHMEHYGIPASITLGQAILESGYGNGYLARVANNHFCIKCKKSWTGGRITHADDNPDDCFRVYDSPEASFRDHADFLNEGTRYDFLFAYATDDYKSWAKGLKQAGYATAHDYDQRLINIIERYSLHILDGKDGIARYDEYMAHELGIDLQALAGEAAAEESVTQIEERGVAPRDIATAYADSGIDPNNFRVTMNSHHGYNVYLTNGAHYIVAKAGDSFASLGALFDIAPATLRKFNDLKGEVEPAAGDIVYIERKASRWNGDAVYHTVVAGENLYLISQLYGIRLQPLSKLNRVRASETLTPGQTIKLR